MKPTSLLSRFSAAKKAVEEHINEFIEEFPNFLDVLAEGYRNKESPDEYTRKERLFKRFIQHDKILFGKKSVYRVHSLWSMAEFYREHYRYGEAEKFYCTAVALLLSSIEEEQRLPFEFRHKLSHFIAFLDNYNKTADAELLQRRLMAETSQSATAREKADDHALLALLCLKNGKEQEAATFFKQARDLIEPILGPDSAELVDYLYAQKFVFERANVSQSFLADCKKHLHLLEILCIMDRALGNDHHSSIPALDELKSYYLAKGKIDLAERIALRREIAFLAAKVKSGDYPGVVRDLKKLSELYEARKEGADATLAFHARARIARLEKAAQKRS